MGAFRIQVNFAQIPHFSKYPLGQLGILFPSVSLGFTKYKNDHN